jgi:hypothetical protein
MRTVAAILVLCLAAIVPAQAQFGRSVDFTGLWKLELQGGDGKAETLLDIRSKGGELTGTLQTAFGKFPIENGSYEGDDLFFNVVIERDEYRLKTTYRGHRFGEEIQFTVEAGERMLQYIARKAGRS